MEDPAGQAEVMKTLKYIRNYLHSQLHGTQSFMDEAEDLGYREHVDGETSDEGTEHRETKDEEMGDKVAEYRRAMEQEIKDKKSGYRERMEKVRRDEITEFKRTVDQELSEEDAEYKEPAWYQGMENQEAPSDKYGNSAPSVQSSGLLRRKRNPRCLRSCLKRGYIHPAQCHMLC